MPGPVGSHTPQGANPNSSPPRPSGGYGTSVNGQTFRVPGQGERVHAPAIQTWGNRPAGDAYRNAWDSVAAQLNTQNPIAIRTEIERQLYRAEGLDAYRTATPAQGPAQSPAQTPANTGTPSDGGPSSATLALDLTQLVLDITGIIEPTPISDGSNAVISVGRSIGSLFGGNFGEAGGHLLNGTLSAIGIIPYLGDAAKAGKIGKWAQTVSDAVSAIAKNPALRETLGPALRQIHELVGKIPQGALDALPRGARESLERMKSQLDEFVGAGSRNLSDIPVNQLDRSSILNNLDTLDVRSAPDSAIFYSGRGAREAAQTHAQQTGKTTLESTAGGEYLDDLRLFDDTVPDVDGDAAMDIWSRVSTRYADEASGSVTAFVNNPRAESVFLTKELPALLDNGNVTEIIVRGGNNSSVTIAPGTSLADALDMISGLQ